MHGIEWLFPVMLISALILAGILAFFQQRRYVRAVNAAARRSEGREDALVTGRGNGFARGAVVVMVIDRSESKIIHCEAMVGATVFARFRPKPELLGPVEGSQERAETKQLARAVENALAQLPQRATTPAADRNKLERARQARRQARERAATRP